MHSPQSIQNTMLRAVEAAARATRFVHASTSLDGVSKDDRSPVTIADWASQAVVATMLAEGRDCASIPLVGEEDAAALRAPESAPLLARVAEAVGHALGAPATCGACLEAIDLGRAAPGPRFFTLDPVDGTKGFLRRQQYAISLALIEDGRVTRGVLGCPNLPASGANYDEADATGSFASAALGAGAFLHDGAGIPTPIRVADWSSGSPVRACESVESGHSKQDLSVELLADLGASGTPARLDSQAKYLVVARGGADAYLRLPVKKDYREKIWDHAAGALIAAEAGARVCDVDGRPLDFGCGRELTRNRGVFAGHPEIVARLVEGFARRGL